MSNQPNPNTIIALERIMLEMQNLVAHPRIQQRTWVARAKEWLPLLQIVHGELTGQRLVVAPDDNSMLVCGLKSLISEGRYQQ